MTRPIFTGAVAGGPIRFYPSPEAPLDAPWSAHDDLAAALGACEHNSDAALAVIARELPEHLANAQDHGNIVAIVSYEVATLTIAAVQGAHPDVCKAFRIAAMQAYFIALKSAIPESCLTAFLNVIRVPRQRAAVLAKWGDEVGSLLIDAATGGAK